MKTSWNNQNNSLYAIPVTHTLKLKWQAMSLKKVLRLNSYTAQTCPSVCLSDCPSLFCLFLSSHFSRCGLEHRLSAELSILPSNLLVVTAKVCVCGCVWWPHQDCMCWCSTVLQSHVTAECCNVATTHTLGNAAVPPLRSVSPVALSHIRKVKVHTAGTCYHASANTASSQLGGNTSRLQWNFGCNAPLYKATVYHPSRRLTPTRYEVDEV